MRRGPAIVTCLVLALVLAAPALADARSHDLRVATTTKIDTLNPLVGPLAAEHRVWALNYDLLVAFDRKTMQPDVKHSLVESVAKSADQLTWTYRLRPGLKWSDGVPLTARGRRLDDELHHTLARAELGRGRQALAGDDPLTVMAHLRHRSVEMQSLWIYILPKHIWKQADTESWETFKPPLPLVGSGPYTVTSWNPDGTTVMTRNPFFRRAASDTGPQRVLMTYYGDGNGAVTRPRAEPPRRDAERHARRPERAAAAAHGRRARLPLARRSGSSTGSSTSRRT